jgi:hypothetical protein
MSQEIIQVAGPPPPSVAVADAAALIRQNEQLQAELATTRAQAARLQEQDRTDKKHGAINAVLAGAPLVPGTAGQLASLLERDIALHTDPGTGQVHVVGPNLTPVDSYVRTQLAKPEFAHFLTARNPQGGTAGSQSSQSAPTPPGWSTAPAPPATASESIEQWTRSQAGHSPDPIRSGAIYMKEDGSACRNPPAAGFGLRKLG